MQVPNAASFDSLRVLTLRGMLPWHWVDDDLKQDVIGIVQMLQQLSKLEAFGLIITLDLEPANPAPHQAIASCCKQESVAFQMLDRNHDAIAEGGKFSVLHAAGPCRPRWEALASYDKIFVLERDLYQLEPKHTVG